ncbi:hypothetical protein N0V82_009439 [Gnomoniopsis sp. IMI 355080]|nr:hypothetical protein N0V82_009439 [Gnomoniopsis sp. IMI 355080]
MDICTMMKEYCNISLQHFVMAGIDKDGKLVTFTGPRETVNPMVLKQYVDLEGYYNWYNTGSMIPTPSPSSYEDGYFGHGDPGRQISSTYGGRRPYDRRRMQSAYDFDDESTFRTRKRARGTMGGRREDAGPAVQVVVAKKGLRIGNHDDVWKFYEQRFKSIQQTACKTIAKAWIKLIAPKKQSNHPYTGQEAKAPDWWPKPTGSTKEERVRHKEPDHLHKPERIWLLNHILALITTPNRLQHRDLQKLNINVAKLEDATWDALSGFFADIETPNNMKKKPYLKEIFRVAKYQERYKNGEIDADTEVMVTADDKIPDEPEDDDQDEGPHDNDDNQPTPTSPPKAEHSLPTLAASDQNTGGNIPGGASFIGDLPVRGQQYSQPSMMQSDIGAGSSSYVGGNSLGVNNQPSMSQTHSMSLSEPYSDPHAVSRRSSLYASPTEYAGSSSSGIYQNWQQSTPANTSPVYSFQHSHQQPSSAGAYVEQQPVSLTQAPQYLEAPTFDPMHTGPPSLFRPTSVPQGPVNTHTTHSFPNYHSTHGSASLPRPHDENDSKRWNL